MKEIVGVVIEGDIYEIYEVWIGLMCICLNFEFKFENKVEKQKFDVNQVCWGCWVLYQQFLYLDDWDNECQCYIKLVFMVCFS